MEQGEIESTIRSTPPACVQGLSVTSSLPPRKLAGQLNTTWALSCKCGSESARILGYPLRSLNPAYKGDLFVSPLYSNCSACGETVEILNTLNHGYHAEVAKIEPTSSGSATYRGAGTPETWACPQCHDNIFRTAVAFVYWDFDLMDDFPDFPGQNFFNEFLIFCTCVHCGHLSEPTDFRKL